MSCTVLEILQVFSTPDPTPISPYFRGVPVGPDRPRWGQCELIKLIGHQRHRQTDDMQSQERALHNSASRAKNNRVKTYTKLSTKITNISFVTDTVRSKTRKLSYCKGNRAMRPIYGSTENFRSSLTTPVTSFPELSNGLLFLSIL